MKFNLKAIKDTAIAFLYLEPVANCHINILVDHPYFDSLFVMERGGGFIDILNDKEGLKRVQHEIEERILGADSVFDILFFMRKPYYLTFLQHIREFLDKRTFDRLLAYMWVVSENPNQDANVDIPTFIEWFSRANRRTIMTAEEYKYYEALPEEVTVYRGVAVGRKGDDGLSWTANYDTAHWFAHRFDTESKKGSILAGKIKKDDIFAYFNSRKEDELCCNSHKVYDIALLKEE